MIYMDKEMISLSNNNLNVKCCDS